jgi:serine/threonine protein phosphatase 1
LRNYSQVFAVGDIHGCKELLNVIHNKIIEVSKNNEGEKLLIYLGDYIDREPDIKGTIQTLIDFQPENFTKVFLLGNHEQMLLDFMAGKRNSLYIWLGNGGLETLESYGCDLNSYIDNSMELKGEELIRKQFTRLLPFSHKSFFNQLILNYEWGSYFFVHAGINPDLPIEKQEKETMLWTREKNFFNPKMTCSKIIVHGHSPVEKIEKYPFRINLDTGSFYSGKLSCLKIENGELSFLNT